MVIQKRLVGILMEGDYYEPEIWYYRHRFAEEGIEVHFLSRMWGKSSEVVAAGFKGHEYKISFDGHVQSFENMDDSSVRSYSAIIIPAGMVADRLRFTEDINKLPPASEFIRRVFNEKGVIKGIICHGLWLLAPVPELAKGRRIVTHNNLLGDVKNMGAVYVDQDVVVDGDLVTGRTGRHCHLFARKIIDMMNSKISA